MNRSLVLLLTSASAAALVGACSAGPDSGALYGSTHGTPTQAAPSGSGSGSGGSTGNTTGTSSGSTNSGSSSGGTTPSGSSSGGAPGTSSGGLAPPPSSGPGSTASQAHQFFDTTVYPELAVCQGCHASGTDGAPKMMVAPADNTYSLLDSLGLIQSQSALLTQGTHDSGKAPALTSQQQTDISTWLNMEAQDRAGQAAPPNILAEVAKCVSQTEWNNIGWSKLKTTPRSGENPQRCTGCNNDPCNMCHDGGEQGFFMAEGTNLEPAGTTFQQTFLGSAASTYMIQYFGLNGTTPVASNGIMTKQTAVGVAPAYSHPMFTMPATMVTALNTFVNDAITNYTNKTCTGTGSSDAGTGGD